MKGEILNYYQALYTVKEPWRPTAAFENLTSLSVESSEGLKIRFEETEIGNAKILCF